MRLNCWESSMSWRIFSWSSGLAQWSPCLKWVPTMRAVAGAKEARLAAVTPLPTRTGREGGRAALTCSSSWGEAAHPVAAPEQG